MNATTGLFGMCLPMNSAALLRRSADFAGDYDCVRFGSFANSRKQSTNDVPMIVSPPMPTHVDWPCRRA